MLKISAGHKDNRLSGNQSLLQQSPIAVFCSKEIPLSIYYTANEAFTQMLRLPVTIAGGWQSAMEKRVLKNYSQDSSAGIIYFLAKSIQYLNLPSYLKSLMDRERLLIVSPAGNKKRIDKNSVVIRDNLILSLVTRYFFLYISPCGYLEGIFNRCLREQKEVFVLEHTANAPYFNEQAKPLSIMNLKEGLIGKS